MSKILLNLCCKYVCLKVVYLVCVPEAILLKPFLVFLFTLKLL